jgi:CRP-like cAMP-binding protein
VTCFGNEVLDGLSAEQHLALRGHLEEAVLKTGDLLDAEGQEVQRVYFPIDALISIFAGKSQGEGIEAASIGSNGMTAPSALLDDTIALGDTVVQLGGRAWWIPVSTLRQLAESDPDLRSHLLGRICQVLRDIMDTSLCAGRYSITQRLARWLVQATNSVGAQRLVITHAALAAILGVRRPSVTLGLQTIEGYGFIRSTRRTIVLRDPEGLADLARLNGRS